LIDEFSNVIKDFRWLVLNISVFDSILTQPTLNELILFLISFKIYHLFLFWTSILWFVNNDSTQIWNIILYGLLYLLEYYLKWIFIKCILTDIMIHFNSPRKRLASMMIVRSVSIQIIIACIKYSLEVNLLIERYLI
jgi:hypothetical protein